MSSCDAAFTGRLLLSYQYTFQQLSRPALSALVMRRRGLYLQVWIPGLLEVCMVLPDDQPI